MKYEIISIDDVGLVIEGELYVEIIATEENKSTTYYDLNYSRLTKKWIEYVRTEWRAFDFSFCPALEEEILIRVDLILLTKNNEYRKFEL